MKINKSYSELENRKVQRTQIELKTIVQVKESNEEAWKEVTKVTTVSRNGAGFNLTRKCQVGRLAMLVLPLPVLLRAYDIDTELYPVVGLVQYCNPVNLDGEDLFHIGVAFVGKQIPESYKADPQQSYRISGMNDDGLWNITESNTPFQNRKDARFCVPLEVTVSLLKSKKKSVSKETTVTKNISASGVSVPCSLEANVGDRVKFASKEHDFYALAVVRNRKEGSGGPPTLHLEFVEDKFPMEKILFSHEYALPVESYEQNSVAY